MKVKVTAAFNDMTVADENARRREIGTEFDVSDTRGIELTALQLVEPVGAMMVDGIPFGIPPLDVTPLEQSTATSHAPAADATAATDPLHLSADMPAPDAPPAA